MITLMSDCTDCYLILLCRQETKQWSGMVKDLLDHKTDLCLALSINTQRSAFIDFTSSYYEDQVRLSRIEIISIIYTVTSLIDFIQTHTNKQIILLHRISRLSDC